MPYTKPEDFPTYEEWLAASQPLEPTSGMSRFPVDSANGAGNYPSRRWWEHATSEDYLSGKHTDKDTATRWTLHLNVPQTQEYKEVPVESVSMLAGLIMLTGCEALTGEYIGGDSFWQWAEEYDPEDGREMGRALHVTFVADDLDKAGDVAEALCRALGGIYLDAHYVCFSTGADWAEQSEVWER